MLSPRPSFLRVSTEPCCQFATAVDCIASGLYVDQCRMGNFTTAAKGASSTGFAGLALLALAIAA